jgi:hypothetical protein
MSNFWLFKKHSQAIQITPYKYLEFRNIIYNVTEFTPAQSNDPKRLIFNWDCINPKFTFWFDYIGCETEISECMKKSSLSLHQKVFVETLSDEPIIIVDTIYFIENWNDFINANQGMGSLVISENMELLMEFTDDAEYLLYSNFPIKP